MLLSSIIVQMVVGSWKPSDRYANRRFCNPTCSIEDDNATRLIECGLQLSIRCCQCLLCSFLYLQSINYSTPCCNRTVGYHQKENKTLPSHKAGVCMQLASSEQGHSTIFESNARKGKTSEQTKPNAAPSIRWSHQPGLPTKSLRLGLIHPNTLQ